MANPKGPPKPTEDEKCHAKARSGARCGNRAVVGLKVCRMHGGSTQRAKAKSEKAKLVRKMDAFVKPIAADDPEADPYTAFTTEFRRTLGRIRWYDEQLAEMSKKDLTWGRSQEEEIGAGEFTGTNTTYEAKANVIHEMQFRERQHLVNMTKIWIGANLDEKKLDIQRAYVRALDSAIIGILSALGHDVSDPDIRQVVRDNLLALGPGQSG